MSVFGLTASGFVRMRLSDIQSECQDALISVFGNSINLLPGSVFNKLVGLFSDRENTLWEAMEDIYNGADPDLASGITLDNICLYTGVQRLPATPSVSSLTATGTAGTLIPTGTRFSVNGNATALFQSTQDVVLDGTGAGTIPVQAAVDGPTVAVSGSLTQIVTPVAGLTSVTNPLDAVVGRNVESDAALKLRRIQTIQVAGAGTVSAIQSKLLTLPGVSNVTVFENLTEAVDGSGRPPKSFECVVNGGTDADIYNEIWASKPAGIATAGSINSTVMDSQGQPHVINWSRPTQVDLYVIANITRDLTKFPATGAAQVQTALVNFINSLGIGQDVIINPQLIIALAGIPGIIGVDIRVGTAPAPTGTANIAISLSEIAVSDTSRTTVNLS